MKRKIITINEEKCTGCSLCIPNCPEGAIQIIDGKARLISDLFCDGLGACIGHCPEGAITVEERDAEPYDEIRVMANIVKQGPNTIKAHLIHLREHGQAHELVQAVRYLKEKGIAVPEYEEKPECAPPGGGCPGTRSLTMKKLDGGTGSSGKTVSELSHWPVQLHLISPGAPQYRDSEFILAADCVAYAMGNFHEAFLKGKAVAIACPKLDSGQEVYYEKLKALVNEAGIHSMTVITMQVPCCRGLLLLAQRAVADVGRKIPVRSVVVGIHGDIVKEEWS